MHDLHFEISASPLAGLMLIAIYGTAAILIIATRRAWSRG